MTGALYFLAKKGKYVLLLIVLLLVGFFGYQAYAKWQDGKTPATAAPVKPKEPVIVTGQAVQDTTVARQAKQSPADADIEVKSDPVGITVSANGQRETLTAVSDTTAKLEKDKIVITTNTKAEVDATKMVDRIVAAEMELQDERHKQEVDKIRREQKKDKVKTVIKIIGAFFIGSKL